MYTSNSQKCCMHKFKDSMRVKVGLVVVKLSFHSYKTVIKVQFSPYETISFLPFIAMEFSLPNYILQKKFKDSITLSANVT